MMGKIMNHSFKTMAAFALGGMSVLGVWLICERCQIMNKVKRLMNDVADTVDEKFKDSCCSKNCCDHTTEKTTE